MRSGVQLWELGASQFLASLDTLTEIYAAAMNPQPQQLPGRRSIMETHVGYPSFRAVAAAQPRGGSAGDGPHELVGFAYGFHGAGGQWWHDLVREVLIGSCGRQAADEWLGDSFEVAEVHVHPGHQGRGTGRAMMLWLTAGRPERTAVLSTMDLDTRARRLYRGLGFTDLVREFMFPGADVPYAIMGAALPLRG